MSEQDWERDWSDWTDARRPTSWCAYCGGSGHEITACPVVMEENG